MDILAENARLRAENEQLHEQLSLALQVIAQLQQRVQELEAQVKQDSHNSNWPSSRDKGRTKSLRERSGKQPGGQPGHAGQTLKMVSEPEQVVVHRMATCMQCGHSLASDAIDLPPLQRVVTEHRVEEVVCPCCHTPNPATFPTAVTKAVQYGPQVKALSVYLHQHHLLPFARLTQVLDDLLGTSPAVGTIARWLQEAAALVAEPVEQIKAALRQRDVLHCDETGLYIAGERVWLHEAATPQLTCCEAYPQRGRQGINALGILGRIKKLNPESGGDRRDGYKPFFKATEALEAFFELSHGLVRKFHTGFVEAVKMGNDRLLCPPGERTRKGKDGIN